MTWAKVAVIIIVVVVSTSTVGERNTLSAGPAKAGFGAEFSRQGDFFPVMRFPDKGKFVTTEDDPFLVSIEGLCPPGSPDTAQFELLPPTPSFVGIFDTCRGYALSHAIIAVVPRRGDAGTYTVAIRALNCEGKGGTFEFRVKVRPH